MNFERIIYILKCIFWNWIPATFESFLHDANAGEVIFRSLKSRAPNVHDISRKMIELDFRWSNEPLSGLFTFHSYPFIVCAKRKGSCDDYAHLWKFLLKDYGKCRLLVTVSTHLRAHIMCVFSRDQQFFLLSNAHVLMQTIEEEDLKNRFFRLETLFSYYV